MAAPLDILTVAVEDLPAEAADRLERGLPMQVTRNGTILHRYETADGEPISPADDQAERAAGFKQWLDAHRSGLRAWRSQNGVPSMTEEDVLALVREERDE